MTTLAKFEINLEARVEFIMHLNIFIGFSI